ncbi:hypothetical protein, partial [Chryseobacterium sp. CH1]|uniref:hypothetical protein n=1 Tax=Chryseobacterium sp. CH1 TaxID=713551 RepID=UPI001026E13C
GINEAWRLKESLNAAEFQDVMYKAYENAGKLGSLPIAFNPTQYPDGRNTRTDWMKEIFGINEAWRLKESLNAAEFQDVMYKAYENAGKLG